MKGVIFFKSLYEPHPWDINLRITALSEENYLPLSFLLFY